MGKRGGKNGGNSKPFNFPPVGPFLQKGGGEPWGGEEKGGEGKKEAGNKYIFSVLEWMPSNPAKKGGKKRGSMGEEKPPVFPCIQNGREKGKKEGGRAGFFPHKKKKKKGKGFARRRGGHSATVL